MRSLSNGEIDEINERKDHGELRLKLEGWTRDMIPMWKITCQEHYVRHPSETNVPGPFSLTTRLHSTCTSFNTFPREVLSICSLADDFRRKFSLSTLRTSRMLFASVPVVGVSVLTISLALYLGLTDAMHPVPILCRAILGSG